MYIKTKVNHFIFLLFILLFNTAISQPVKDYFAFPIYPGKINYLSGTMGELRPNHFHGGIDIKTGMVEGWPVYAPAEGYISRINISSTGYGNALYMTHPNGYVTVYGHLKSLVKPLSDYLIKEQYNKKTFDIDLYPSKGQFFFKKGEIIGYAGNTGASGGPHLHFEIRDTFNTVFNPLHFGFENEIKDNVPPIVEKIALVTLDKNSRINYQYGRFEFYLTRLGGKYVFNTPIKVFGRIGIEILAHDKLTNSQNRNGVPLIDVILDNINIFSQNITNFQFDKNRDIQVLINYPVKLLKGLNFNRLYVEDGNELNFYKNSNGIIEITDSALHPVAIELTDAYNNKSVVNFTMQGSKPVFKVTSNQIPFKGTSGYFVDKNTLFTFMPINTWPTKHATFQVKNNDYKQLPDYALNNTAVYMWDLRKGLPTKIIGNPDTFVYEFKAVIPSNTEFSYYDNELSIIFPNKALFDTLYLQTRYEYDSLKGLEYFNINEREIPLRKHIEVTLKPIRIYTPQNKYHVYSVNQYGRMVFQGGLWDGDHIRFSTRDLGTFTIALDTVPPVIKKLRLSTAGMAFTIRDEMSGISSYNAWINGEWILMNYDKKTKLIWSEKLDKTKPIKGEVILKVVDNAGNEAVFKTNL